MSSHHAVKMEGFQTPSGEMAGSMLFIWDTPEEVAEFKKRIIGVWQNMVDERAPETVISIIPGEKKVRDNEIMVGS